MEIKKQHSEVPVAIINLVKETYSDSGFVYHPSGMYKWITINGSVHYRFIDKKYFPLKFGSVTISM